MFKVAVQLLSWNGEKHLRPVLASIAKQTYLDFELLILDNGSNDGSVKIIEDALKTFPRPSNFLKSEKNLGFAGGHDALFAMSDAPYVFCVNQDVVLSDDYLERIVEFLEKSSNVGSASGILRHEDESVDTAGLAKNWYEKTYDIAKAPSEPETRVFGVSGALPVYRRAAVLDVSPDGKIFDETFFAYKEDVDLAWRLNIFGWSSYTIAAARAVHERAFGADKKGDATKYAKQKLSSRNHLLTLVKDLPADEFWRLPIIILYELGKMAYLSIFVPKSLGYISDFFHLLPGTIKVRKVIWQRLKEKQTNG
jgi:GT2 family glycosyltransferase